MRRLVPAARDASDDEPTAPGRPDAVVVPAAAYGDDEAEDGSRVHADQPPLDKGTKVKLVAYNGREKVYYVKQHDAAVG